MPLSGARAPCQSVLCGPQPWRVDGKWRGRLTPPGSEVQVTTCPRAPWIYYSICPCAPCAQLPPPRGLFSLSFLKCLLCPSVHPALFFYRVPSRGRAVLHVGSGSSANTAGQRLGPCGSRGRVLGSEPESLAPLSPGGSPSSRASISLPADDLRADLSSARNPPVVLQECVGLGGSGTLPRAWQAPSPWEGKDSHHVQPPGRRGPG